MAAANTSWGVGSINPSNPHLRQPCSHLHLHLHLFGKKESNLSFVGSIINKPISANTRNSTIACCCSTSWDWNRWTRHFSDIERTENLTSVLKSQLENAIEKEDFQEAAKLKRTMEEATSKDSVAEIMCQLKNAIDDERYHDASRLCKLTGSGLVGWWVGCSKNCDDPFGRVVRITPGVGRFVARSFTPRQLATAASGTPLFEIFVSKEADQTYNMQVVFLQRAKGGLNDLTAARSPSKPPGRPLTPYPGNSSMDSSSGNETSSAEGSGVNNLNTKDANNIADSSEEGLNSVINYLKEKIPDSNFKILKANVPKEVIDDNESLEQSAQDDSSPENSESEVLSENDIQLDETQLGGGTDTRNGAKHMATKIFIGGILHNKDDAPMKDDYVRLAAEIKDMERDSFLLHVPGRNNETDLGENKVALAAEGVSEVMPLEVANIFLGVENNPSKVSRDIHEVFKLATSKRNGLSRDTSFSRITTSKDDLDPFDGLYVGAFGPLGAELIQLRRKFGNWHSEGEAPDAEFFEYVEAVKLTGDLNVPAGQVTFRAKVGKGNRNSNRGKYPDDLGVVASYRGQGKIADIGFRNPRWVEGELLQLSGRGMWPYIGGADLGFLYVVPEKSFLVLLNRLKLPE